MPFHQPCMHLPPRRGVGISNHLERFLDFDVQLLVNYGVVEENNPYDKLQLTATIPNTDPNFKVRGGLHGTPLTMQHHCCLRLENLHMARSLTIPVSGPAVLLQQKCGDASQQLPDDSQHRWGCQQLIEAQPKQLTVHSGVVKTVCRSR